MADKLVFIDESGDPGKSSSASSSNLFVIAAVVVDRADAAALEKTVSEAKKEWGKSELKFSRLSEKHRRQIFAQLALHHFSSYSIVVDKGLLRSPGLLYTDVFFKFFFGHLVSVLGQRYDQLEIYFDQFGNIAFQEGLKNYIKKRYERTPLFEPYVMGSLDSRLSELTQVADLVAGAVARATNAHKNRHRDIWFLSQLSAQQKVLQFWPLSSDSAGGESLVGPTPDDILIAAESERRIKLAMDEGPADELQNAVGELLLYSERYISGVQLVHAIERLDLECMNCSDEQKLHRIQRHGIRALRDKGALIDSNSGTLDPGYGLIRTISQARNFKDCQIKRASSMVRRAEMVNEAVEIATHGRVSISSIPPEALLHFMRLVNAQPGVGIKRSN